MSFDNVDRKHFFVYSRLTLRGRNYSSPDGDIRKFTFSNLIIDEWNSLPQDVIDSCTVYTFKIDWISI